MNTGKSLPCEGLNVYIALVLVGHRTSTGKGMRSGSGGQFPAHIPVGDPLPGLIGRCAKSSPGPGSLPVMLSSSYAHGLTPHPSWALNPTGLGDHGTVLLSARFSYCQAGQVAQLLRGQEETSLYSHPSCTPTRVLFLLQTASLLGGGSALPRNWKDRQTDYSLE